jgi:hypothetical protein
MCLIITGRGISRSPGNIPKDQPEMTEPPWLIAIKASDRASGAAVHHDLALQRSRRGAVVTTIADAAVNIPLLMFRTSTVSGSCRPDVQDGETATKIEEWIRFCRSTARPSSEVGGPAEAFSALRLIRAIKGRGFGKYWAGERPGTAARVA